jgi:hypothetical protein
MSGKLGGAYPHTPELRHPENLIVLAYAIGPIDSWALGCCLDEQRKRK